MNKKKTPAPQRAGTDTDQIPRWVLDELRGDPELLRDVAALVKNRVARSRQTVDRRR